MILVYKTDIHHSYSSRDIIGCTSQEEIAIQICKEKAEKEGEEICDEQLWNLANIKQTQNYSGEGEFQFEHLEEDTLL